MNNTFLLVETPQLSITHHPDQYRTEMTVHGTWDDDLRTTASHGLRAGVAETPQALIVDLSQLIDPVGASAPTWRTASRYAATRRPAVNLVFCGVPPEVLSRLETGSAGRAATVTETMAAARRVAQRPQSAPYRRRLTLAMRDDAASAGRTMAGDACLAWGLRGLSYPARAIMSELITNAVEHAGNALMAGVSVRGDVLHLAVQDGDSALPRLIEASPYRPGEAVEQRGAGLRLVRATASAWGALPCPVGKVVWATLVREVVDR